MTARNGNVKVTFWRSRKLGKAITLAKETVPVFPVPGWEMYLTLVPTCIAAILLAIVFFAAFFALFASAAVGLALWLWWLRRKLRKGNGVHMEGEYVEINEAQVMKERTDNLDHQ